MERNFILSNVAEKLIDKGNFLEFFQIYQLSEDFSEVSSQLSQNVVSYQEIGSTHRNKKYTWTHQIIPDNKSTFRVRKHSVKFKGCKIRKKMREEDPKHNLSSNVNVKKF